MTRPDALWLVCWAVGGIVLMSLVPSKRPDRIFPAIPPMCLLLVYVLRETQSLPAWKTCKIAVGLLATAVAISGAYTVWNLMDARREQEGGLVEFSERVRFFAKQHGLRFAIASGKDEGMLLYLNQTIFAKYRDAEKAWRDGNLDALVLNAQDFSRNSAGLAPWELWDASRSEGDDKNSQYFFIVRKQEHAP